MGFHGNPTMLGHLSVCRFRDSPFVVEMKAGTVPAAKRT